MNSLFNAIDNQDIIERINSLTNKSQAQWGKMNVSQMVTHCQAPLKVAFGEMKLKRGIPGILFGSMIRKKLTRDEKPFDKNLPTDKGFIVVDEREFEKEKNTLVQLVKRFQEAGPSAMSTDPHPFFGKMTAAEWDIIQWKHLDHHLKQFGV
jgi:hypothetical protein